MSDVMMQVFVYVIRRPMTEKDDMYTSSVHPLTITQTQDGKSKRVRFEHKWCGAWIGDRVEDQLVLRVRGDGKEDAVQYLHISQPLSDGNYQLLQATHPAYDAFPTESRHNNRFLVLLVRIPNVEYVYRLDDSQVVPDAS